MNQTQPLRRASSESILDSLNQHIQGVRMEAALSRMAEQIPRAAVRRHRSRPGTAAQSNSLGGGRSPPTSAAHTQPRSPRLGDSHRSAHHIASNASSSLDTLHLAAPLSNPPKESALSTKLNTEPFRCIGAQSFGTVFLTPGDVWVPMRDDRRTSKNSFESTDSRYGDEGDEARERWRRLRCEGPTGFEVCLKRTNIVGRDERGWLRNDAFWCQKVSEVMWSEERRGVRGVAKVPMMMGYLARRNSKQEKEGAGAMEHLLGESLRAEEWFDLSSFVVQGKRKETMEETELRREGERKT